MFWSETVQSGSALSPWTNFNDWRADTGHQSGKQLVNQLPFQRAALSLPLQTNCAIARHQSLQEIRWNACGFQGRFQLSTWLCIFAKQNNINFLADRNGSRTVLRSTCWAIAATKKHQTEVLKYIFWGGAGQVFRFDLSQFSSSAPPRSGEVVPTPKAIGATWTSNSNEIPTLSVDHTRAARTPN